jgi:hypothetical protein
MSLKTTTTGFFLIFNALLESTAGGILKTGKGSHFIYPTGKPRIPHLQSLSAFGGLPRVRGRLLQLHPRRLRSAASSTFATLGIGFKFLSSFPSINGYFSSHRSAVRRIGNSPVPKIYLWMDTSSCHRHHRATQALRFSLEPKLDAHFRSSAPLERDSVTGALRPNSHPKGISSRFVLFAISLKPSLILVGKISPLTDGTERSPPGSVWLVNFAVQRAANTHRSLSLRALPSG